MLSVCAREKKKLPHWLSCVRQTGCVLSEEKAGVSPVFILYRSLLSGHADPSVSLLLTLISWIIHDTVSATNEHTNWCLLKKKKPNHYYCYYSRLWSTQFKQKIKLMQWWEKYFSNSPVLTLSLIWKQI